MKNDAPSRRERGSALTVSLLVMVLLLLLGTALLTLSDLESEIDANDRWSEGAFYAAEAGVQSGIDQLSSDHDTSIQAIPVTNIDNRYNYRSGGRDEAGPQPFQFIGVTQRSGYSLGVGTGYNETGYVFRNYQINATGSGPRNAQREVEVRVDYGPVAQ